MLRGQRGSPVSVTVMREGATEPVTVTVIRGEIETSLVDAFWLKPGIAFLKVTSFEAQNVARDVEAALQKLDESKIKGLILDLRHLTVAPFKLNEATARSLMSCPAPTV